jgi:acyl dehydratase
MPFPSAAALRAAIGTTIGTSDWTEISQQRIDQFAEATDDRQWIHTDPERAATGPFGTTIAHGFLTLSLLPSLTGSLVALPGAAMGVNYGLNKVRFPAPVPVGSCVRAVVNLHAVDDVDGGIRLTCKVTIEREGGGKPVCVAETVSRIYF